jgi:hypothetical protein
LIPLEAQAETPNTSVRRPMRDKDELGNMTFSRQKAPSAVRDFQV